MAYRWMPALAAVVTLLSLPVWAYDSLYSRPCVLWRTADKRPGLHMDCLIDSSMSQGYVRQTVKTPDHKVIIIDGTPSDTWQVDHRPAVKTGTESSPCYDTDRLRICFE